MPNNRNRNRNRNRNNNKNNNKNKSNTNNNTQNKQQPLQQQQQEATNKDDALVDATTTPTEQQPELNLVAKETTSCQIQEPNTTTTTTSTVEQSSNHNEISGNDSIVPVPIICKKTKENVAENLATTTNETQTNETTAAATTTATAATKTSSVEFSENFNQEKTEAIKINNNNNLVAQNLEKEQQQQTIMGAKNSKEQLPIDNSKETTTATTTKNAKTKNATEKIIKIEIEATKEQQQQNAAAQLATPSIAAGNSKKTTTTAITVPDSPKQAKVIVHRIVQEVVDDANIEKRDDKEEEEQQEQQEQKSPTLQRSARVIIHKIHLEPEKSQTKTNTTSKQEKTTSIVEISTDVAPQSSLFGGGGTLSPTPRYIVESPKNFSERSVTDFEQLMRDIQIQEISESSSGEFNANNPQMSNDNPPLISEAESETEQTTTTPSDDYKPLTPEHNTTSKVQQEELRAKRVQKRTALESHFLPQLLSPRYLDSILEEQSDVGSEYSLSRSSSANIEERHEAAVKQAKLICEAFPRSQLDFTRRHKLPKVHALLAGDAIREEPQAYVLETKLIDQAHGAAETCTRLSSGIVPESEDAELVYLSSSASSSLSDLLDYELEQAEALAARTLVDLDTDVSALITKPEHSASNTSVASTTISETSTNEQHGTYGDDEALSSQTSRESTPVNHVARAYELSTLEAVKTPTSTPTPTPTMPTPATIAANYNKNNENEVSKLEDDCAVSNTIRSDTKDIKSAEYLPCSSSSGSNIIRANENGTKQNSFSSSAAPKNVKPSSSSSESSVISVTEISENFEKAMDKMREIVEASKRAEDIAASSSSMSSSSCITSDGMSSRLTPPPPPVPPPPAPYYDNLDIYTNYTNEALNNTNHNNNNNLHNNHNNNSSNNILNLPLLKRQESADSHCSDSTQYSQCTAIQIASPTTPLSPQPQQEQQQQHVYEHEKEQSQQPLDFDVSQSFSDQNREQRISHTTTTSPDVNDAAIKKLRRLCAETLASMPYGEQVLEELANVAQNIGEVRAQHQQTTTTTTDNKMPYPIPDLPHINDLQLSLAAQSLNDKVRVGPARTVTITHISESQPPSLSSLSSPSSPPPPPVPAPPNRYATDAAWLGLPTSADPKLLVCLSPAQQALIDEQQLPSKPDQLLDAHQKFIERRGYHELSSEQVRAINNGKLEEEQQILKTASIMKQLRKSLTPPPVPPPPVPAKSSETAAKAMKNINANTSPTAAATATAAESDVSLRNVNESSSVQVENVLQNNDNNNNKHRLLEIIKNVDDGNRKDTATAAVNHETHNTEQKIETKSTATETEKPNITTTTSSHENNSRQTADVQANERLPPALPQRTSTTTEQVNEQRRKHFSTNSNCTISSSTSKIEERSHQKTTEMSSSSSQSNSGNRFPQSAHMQSVESELARMFPSIGRGDIFDDERKRFSNIESSNDYCSQLLNTKPKRYSNIETSSFETKKRVENGEVIYDYSTRSHEKQEDGVRSTFPVSNKDSSSRFVVNIPITRESNGMDETDKVAATAPPVPPPPSTHFDFLGNKRHAAEAATAAAAEDEQKIMSALNLNTTTENKVSTAATTEQNERTTHINRLVKSEREKVATFKEDINNTYEEFRQRAKAAAEANSGIAAAAAETTPTQAATSNGVNNNNYTAPPSQQQQSSNTGNHFDHEKLFKDFDDLSKQLHMELECGKAQREQRDKSASLFDLSRMQMNSYGNSNKQFEQLKQERHEHMKELEREIERSMRARQDRMSLPRTFDIGGTHAAAAAATQQQVHDIPIVLETEQRNRRAESMCNLNERIRPHTSSGYYAPSLQQEDDWARYASDLGYSENIARPFAREVEICYQRQRQQQQRQPHAIRAPRLSVSTNDLSSTSQSHSYDAYNAYGARRTHAPMLSQVPQQTTQQQQRPHYGSCYSMIERNPNPTYISTTSRRGVSPAPQRPPMTADAAFAAPPDYERQQRRASLPRELHEQQLKYILSKEEELKLEFDRLQNERRRLMEEMQRTPMTPTTPTTPTTPRRESYRPIVAPKLPTLTEDEVFRQQMAEEWLNKVAEREERRLQKIIKISKLHEDELTAAATKSTISDEFLNRVKERRTKLSMPADSDWESGAESQPFAQAQTSESDAEMTPIKIMEGQSEANLRQLPRHLREFAKFSNHETEQIDGGQREVHQEEERRQEANDNSMSSATKKSSIIKTYKVSRLPPSVQQQQTNGGNSDFDCENDIETEIEEIAHETETETENENETDNDTTSTATTTKTATTKSTRKSNTKTTTTTTTRMMHNDQNRRHHPYQFNNSNNLNNNNNNSTFSSPFFISKKIPASFENLFENSPFRSKIFEEFDKYWQNFE